MSPRQRRSSHSFRQQVGARLKQLRQTQNLSQEQVAWEAAVAQGSISNYETGRNDIPLSVLVAICRALNTSPIEVLSSIGDRVQEAPGEFVPVH
jgi:transcriptional regulator with XRE-family HTH domain